MKKLLAAIVCLSWCALSAVAQESLVIVQDGKPNAQIVVAEQAPRMARLAAMELQYYVQKISGARLPIVTTAQAGGPVRIFVGKGPETEKLGVTDEGLKYGAYRMVSGPDWIALLGYDFDFVPPKPWPARRVDRERLVAEWDEVTRGHTEAGWGCPFNSGFKALWLPKGGEKFFDERYGADSLTIWKAGEAAASGFYEHDDGGSLNAVYAFLRRFGVRWFMPGDLGEVVPTMSTLAVKPLNETVKPAFALRNWMYYGYFSFSFDDVIFARRLGMTGMVEKTGLLNGPHGLVPVTRHDAMKKKHPEYYALINGKRDTEHRGYGTPCFSSEGLAQETVRYVRFMFDQYNMPLVDLWPVDGLKGCQCDLCKGKGASDLVWGFIDRVAREVHKTHPDRLISCGAYANYKQAPKSVEKFSPNVVVQIANCGRPLMEDPQRWRDYQEHVKEWADRMAPGNIMRLENSRYFIAEGAPEKEFVQHPVIHPRAIARDLKFLKGISFGDAGEQSQAKFKWCAPAHNSINLYFQSQFLWNPDQDFDALLDEYCALYYGPAAAEMKVALTYAEDNLAHKDQSRPGGRASPGNVSDSVKLRFRELLAKARQAAGDDIYGQRIDLMISELAPAEKIIAASKEKAEALAKARAKAPVAKGMVGADLSKATAYTLKDNKSGQACTPETTFRVGWDKDALLLDVLCKEPNMAGVHFSPDVHNGDYLAISLATPKHSYYHIEVNADGAVVEGHPGPPWKSLADIKTERGADFWRVSLRIPVVGDDEAHADPNHRVSGDKPSVAEPWYFNVGRWRNVPGGAEMQAFSPTQRGWHFPVRFGRLEIR